MFDKDGNGRITISEIKEIFGGVGQVSEKVWQEMIGEVAASGESTITYKEFKDMMLKLLQDTPAQGQNPLSSLPPDNE